MAISPQRVIRYTSCLVLGWGFQGRWIEWRYFRSYPSWRQAAIFDNFGHISATAHSIHLYVAHRRHRAVIFAIAQLSCFCCACRRRRYGQRRLCTEAALLHLMWATIIVEQYTLLPPESILIESILSQRLPTGRRYLADLQVDSERIIVTFQPVRERLGK